MSARGSRPLTALAVTGALLATAAGVTACTERATTHHKPGTSHDVATGPAGTLLGIRDEAGHRLRRLPARDAPTVDLTVRPDTEDGWNVRLAVHRFRFTPDSVGGAAIPGSGHARLLVDGHEVARLYGPWYHLAAEAVPRSGHHTLTARLHADDHTAWAVGDKPVQATAPLTSTSAASGHPATKPPAGRTVEITVAKGRVSPAPGRVEVKRGQRVTLRVTVDADDELHVHGYDRTAGLTAGRTTTLTFTADRTGLFEVETHHTDLLLTQLLVR